MSDKWTHTTLRHVASRIESGGTPSRNVPTYWNGPIPWVTPGEITKHHGKYLADTQEKITTSGLASSGATLLPANSLMVTTRATLGSAALAAVPMATNQGFKSLVFGNGIDPSFYYHLIETLSAELAKRASGTTFLEISAKEFASIPVPMPPLREQRKIAEILDSVDETIGSAELLLRKLRQTREGLVRQLTTPNPIDSTTWETCSLVDVVPVVEYGVSYPLTYDAGTPVLRMNNLSRGEVMMHDLKSSPYPIPQNLLLNPGDVLFNRTNSFDHVGRTAVYRGGTRPISFASYLVRLCADQSKLTNEYLNLWLNRPEIQQDIRVYATPGVHQVNINPTNLRKSIISFPSIDEQKIITRRVATWDTYTKATSDELSKQRKIRQGLMDDLLTGRIRVKGDTAGKV